MRLPKFLKKLIPQAPSTNEAADFAKNHSVRFAEKKQRQLSRDAERHSHKRKEERQELSAIGELSIPEKGFSMEGIISEASRGGLTFRPATTYMVERSGERVQIVADRIKRTGVIRSTRANGYGVQLMETLSPSDLDLLKNVSVALVKPRFADDDMDDEEAA